MMAGKPDWSQAAPLLIIATAICLAGRQAAERYLS